ncbi:hypothetical protein SAMN04489761_2013 [Tenacibaculum sp. MAR_2009_124]|uniref:hypothetical protein n=1 Tax=Tenacibaculum sp. MAR_2009_124 TaxID=1250059 RepID=UPI000894B454|nr:hypothetical protein [Tenacibaculum sp. MAR_2009_124]SEB87173.1 hypothetical protein SAMN04489761_2013 [Tenacibaculum sp. MAR_2009_124]
MISEFKLIWKKLNLDIFPNGSHLEYLIDGVNLKDIIDVKFGYNSFVEENEYVGWINDKMDLKNLELSVQILKGEKINNLLLKENSQLLNYDFGSKIPLYTCSCGHIGCGGLMVDVFISGNKITWDFDDKLMPIIVFNLEQYREEIDLKMKEFKINRFNNA